jgi:hypothetical protein
MSIVRLLFCVVAMRALYSLLLTVHISTDGQYFFYPWTKIASHIHKSRQKVDFLSWTYICMFQNSQFFLCFGSFPKSISIIQLTPVKSSPFTRANIPETTVLLTTNKKNHVFDASCAEGFTFYKSKLKVYYFLVQAKRSCSALNLILLLLFWSIFVTHFSLS